LIAIVPIAQAAFGIEYRITGPASLAILHLRSLSLTHQLKQNPVLTVLQNSL
jgi:hypothetical protein